MHVELTNDSMQKGLKDFKFGKGIVSTAHRAKGYQYGLVATLESPEDLLGYAAHATHQV